jgi:hypothetical protein
METRNEKILRLFKNGNTYQDLGCMFNFSKTRAREIIVREMEKDILKLLNLNFFDLSLEEKLLLYLAVKEEIAEIIMKWNESHSHLVS